MIKQSAPADGGSGAGGNLLIILWFSKILTNSFYHTGMDLSKIKDMMKSFGGGKGMEKIKELMSTLKNGGDMQAAMKKIMDGLTPEQKAKFQKIFAKVKGLMAGAGGKMKTAVESH